MYSSSLNNKLYSQMTFQDYVQVLKKQKVFILLFCITAILSSLALTYVFSERYLAATTIMYRPMEKSLFRYKEIKAFGMPAPVPSYDSISQNIRDAVQNEVILRPVVEQLRLDQEITPEYSTWYEKWYNESKKFTKKQLKNAWCFLKHGRIIEEDPTVAAIKNLRENIDITSTKETNIFTLSVKDKYPHRAAEIVNLSGELLVTWLKDEHQGPALAKLVQLDKGLTEKLETIEKLRGENEALLGNKNIVSIGEETDKGLQNLYEMKIEQVRVSALVKQKEKEIKEYRQTIRNGIANHINPKDIEALKSKKLFEEVKLQGLKEQNTYLLSSIGKLKKQLEELPILKNKLDDINMKIESAQRDFFNLKDLRLECLEQAETDQVEARILHHAVIKADPIQPIKIYHVGLTAFLSLLLSCGLVYVLDFLKIKTFFSPHDDFMPTILPGSSRSQLPSSSVTQQTLFLEELAKNLAAESGSLFLLEDNNLIRVKSLDPGHAPAVIPVQKAEGSVFHKALNTGQPILIEDINNAGDISSSSWTGYKNPSLVVFPVQDESKNTIGLVSLHNKISPPFTQQDIQFGLEMLAEFPHQSTAGNFSPMTVDGEYAHISKNADPEMFKPLAPFIRYALIILSGTGIAVAVFYLLRKMGY